MPHATTGECVKLYQEEAGDGAPILFVHEYAGDWRSWEPQMRLLARRHRCITFSFRGYPRSDVPESERPVAGQRYAVADALSMLNHLNVPRAHIVGLSQGAFAAAHFGRLHADRALSLTLAGIGSGAVPDDHEQYKKRDARATAARIREQGMAKYAAILAAKPTRTRFKQKDPRGFADFVQRLAEHPDVGAANTMENYQGARPSLYDFEGDWKKLALPTLIICGDEDEPCVRPTFTSSASCPTPGSPCSPRRATR